LSTDRLQPVLTPAALATPSGASGIPPSRGRGTSASAPMEALSADAFHRTLQQATTHGAALAVATQAAAEAVRRLELGRLQVPDLRLLLLETPDTPLWTEARQAALTTVATTLALAPSIISMHAQLHRLPAATVREGHGADSEPFFVRGSGQCSRQVNNFAAAATAGGDGKQSFEAGRLIAVEVLTPGGNWSSYPPHKHDEHREGVESELEEIYYYEIAPHHTPQGGTTEGLGYQRVTPSGHGKGTDVLAEVRSGDAVLIPDGWHGPSMAAPGHDMYYLNVMAGPGVDRAWLICDHPDHAWIRGTWADQPVDPRLPLYEAKESAAARDDSQTEEGAR